MTIILIKMITVRRRIRKEARILHSHNHNHHQGLHLSRADKVIIGDVSLLWMIEASAKTEIDKKDLLVMPRRMNHSEGIIEIVDR